MEIDAVNEELATVPTPHDILWYPDGDVVLATDTFLFKVHKCILSLQSSVFRDLFAFPAADGAQGNLGENGAGVQEMYEGLPLVVLAGDKGEEVVHLLRTVYERDYFYRDDKNTHLKRITALLVLSTKYDFRLIRNDVILQISRQYPTTIKEYQAVDDDDAIVFYTRREDCHFPLLDASLKANADCLLPSLYYACSYYSMDYIIDRCERQSMDPQSILNLVRGRETLKETIVTTLAELTEELQGGEIILCPNATKPCWRVAHMAGLEGFCNSSSLGEIEGKVIAQRLRRACELCTKQVARLVDKKRKTIWVDLPSFYGLRSWKDLSDELTKLS